MTMTTDLANSGIWEYLDSISIGVARVDLTGGGVEFFNPMVRDIFRDVSLEDQLQFFREFQPPSDHPAGLATAMPRRTVKDDLLLSIQTIRDPDGRIWYFLQDVTDVVRLESIAEAVNIMDNIGYIFSGIRHEIGNPINTIKMTMSVLKRNLDGLPQEKIQKYIDRTLEEILRLEELLQSLKSYNMFDTPKPQNLHLPTFMNKFLSLIEQDFQTQGVRIKIFTSGPLWAYVDPRGLQQVMLNLMTNAFDALRLTEAPQVTISMYQFVNQVCIKITDNGCGVPDHQLTDIFQPFYTTKAKGTGLGLVISKKILNKMNSSIRIQSAVQKGTTVILCLPLGVSNE